MSINFTAQNETARKYGTHEIAIVMDEGFGNPYFDLDSKICFIKPDGTKVTVDGFYDGGDWILLLRTNR